MTLMDFLKVIEPVDDITIYGDREEEPLFKGRVLDVPWIFTDCEIKREEKEEPIHFYIYQNEFGTNSIMIVVNIIED